MGVVGGPVAEHLGVDRRASRPGGLELLQHHHGRALAHDEALAERVEGAGRGARVAVADREAAHHAEAREDQRVDAALGASREDHVRIPVPDQLRALADRVRAGGAGGDDRVVRPAQAELDRDLPARRVDEDVGEERRRDPVRPSLPQDVVLAHQLVEAADAVPHDDADALGVEAVETGVLDRLLRGGEGEEDVAVELAQLLGRRRAGRVVVVLDLGRDLNGERARVERLDAVDPALAREQPLPGRPAGRCRGASPRPSP